MLRWIAGIGFLLVGLNAYAADDFKSGGPYVPTPQVVVDQMLRMASVSAKDYVLDLGSGDGVIVLTAARQYKASGMGVDIDSNLVKLSNASAKAQGVADRVHFIEQDVFKADLSRASVLTLYLLPGMMLSLREKIFNELKPGTRIVSHDYHFGDWQPDNSIQFEVPEKEKINGVPSATVYLWTVPAKVAGRWEIKIPDSESYELTLKQRFRRLSASATAGGRAARPQQIELRGDELTFALAEGKGTARFRGRVNDRSMEGTVEMPGAKGPQKWTAVRVAAGKVATE